MAEISLPSWLLATTLLFAGYLPANSSQVMDSSSLLIACGTPDESWISFCNGYVQAIYDAANLENALICPPTGTTRAQMADHVHSGLSALDAGTDARTMKELSGAAATILILSKQYPCD